MAEGLEYKSVPRHMADHRLDPFQTPMPSRPVRWPQQQIRSDCELRYAGYFITVLILTAAQVPAAAEEDFGDDSEMWKMFLDEVDEEDNRFTDAWKEDANSIVVFVSLN